MKKALFYLLATGLSLTFHPQQSNAATSSTEVVTTTEAATADALLVRLNDIAGMNKSNLNSSEKKNLRTEIKSIRQQLKDIGGGVYISVGGLLLIIILLIILL